ncbi:MAG: glycosyltransferase family 4 protein [Acidimicrobiia bacterium]
MIRLLSIQPVAERGGSDQALVRLLASLPSDEFECHVAVPQEPPLRAELEAAGATVHAVPMRRISTSHALGAWARYALAWPVSVVRLVRLARRLDVDLVHTNSLHSWYGWAVAALIRRPHAWHAREIVVQSAAALRLERRLARRATVVIAVSHAVAAQLDAENVVVVHESVDPAVFTPTRAGRFRGQLGIPDDAPLVAAAGRIDTWKGIDVLLDAWPAVVTAVGDARLVVAGGIVQGKEAFAAELGRRAAGLPGVHWTGPRDDIADLLADSDAVAVPSTEPEPYGLVAVEALASGAPVVASDAGGIREIVDAADPGAGTLVAPSDAPALAAALVTVLQAARPTSTARRSSRPSLRTPGADPTPSILHEAVAARPH